MKADYKSYALEFGAIGEKISQISAQIRVINSLSATTFETLKHKKDSFSNTLQAFKECKDKMLKMQVPDVVSVEHNDFVKAFDSFIDGTGKTIDAIDLDTLTINDTLMNEGFEEQKKGSNLAGPITDRIVAKLLIA